MGERTRPRMSPLVSSPAERLPRCCPNHPDWPTLSQHLVGEFPEIATGNVVREVARAKQAVEQVGLEPAEAVTIGELIVRHQLLLLAGRVAEVARLDPERHARAGVTPSAGPTRVVDRAPTDSR